MITTKKSMQRYIAEHQDEIQLRYEGEVLPQGLSFTGVPHGVAKHYYYREGNQIAHLAVYKNSGKSLFDYRNHQ
jgi:hypothetical protein